jgi:hypothetical protein
METQCRKSLQTLLKGSVDEENIKTPTQQHPPTAYIPDLQAQIERLDQQVEHYRLRLLQTGCTDPAPSTSQQNRRSVPSLPDHQRRHTTGQSAQKNTIDTEYQHCQPRHSGVTLNAALNAASIPHHYSAPKPVDTGDGMKAELKRLRAQLREEREEVRRLRVLRGAAEEKLSGRIARLEERARILAKRAQASEQRRITDSTGWQADVTALRRRLTIVERRQKRILLICTLLDDDCRDAALKRHRQLEERECGQADALPFDPENDFHGCVQTLSEELETLQLALGGFEEKLLKQVATTKEGNQQGAGFV